MKYMKKQIIIEAVLCSVALAYFNTETPKEDVPEWLVSAADDGEKLKIEVDCIKLITLEGTMTAESDDWIIQGVKGELYPCKPDIFEETYDAVSDEDDGTRDGALTARSFNPSNNPVVDAIKGSVENLGLFIENNVPEGRRRAIAMMHLESASMFAVKAIFYDKAEPSLYQPHEDRVIEEEKELQLKYTSLDRFILGEVFDDLPDDEKKRLQSQRHFMGNYLKLLRERIDNFEPSKPEED